MTEWIFTFGSNHVHPQTGESLGQRFVAVEAPDADTARTRMFALFGAKWALMYPSREAAGVDNFGLRRLDVDLPEVH